MDIGLKTTSDGKLIPKDAVPHYAPLGHSEVKISAAKRIQKLAREHSEAAFETITELAADIAEDSHIRLQAAALIVTRAVGSVNLEYMDVVVEHANKLTELSADDALVHITVNVMTGAIAVQHAKILTDLITTRHDLAKSAELSERLAALEASIALMRDGPRKIVQHSASISLEDEPVDVPPLDASLPPDDQSVVTASNAPEAAAAPPSAPVEAPSVATDDPPAVVYTATAYLDLED